MLSFDGNLFLLQKLAFAIIRASFSFLYVKNVIFDIFSSVIGNLNKKMLTELLYVV
ncbi:hypothetical protein FC38_GL001248 [Lactobacillus gigeriorum DSM 23908 = CRBIP 24.85]|uniref:Uncharacterized protein n=1 Tax=Lactobacillus gigeriorum DSM 23908 = CRBIP 24.85 TaxID=1423751 RepID=A0ABR5PV54_9LACO|nr:hypothetical protein FC38_GL001248 [Lactobacillus gigeriorum DSM 23908 = CRBIP 24.85]